jgi:hypothetical protein
VLLSMVFLILLDAPSASAQSALDRVVGLTEFGEPLIITKIDGQTIGILAKAAGVPMGFEGLPPLKKKLSIRATKKKLRDVLDAIVAAVPQYEWRDDDDVIVIRPLDAWSDRASPLSASVDAVTLHDVAATDIYGVLTRMVGTRVTPDQGLGDSKRFSVEIRAGSTLLNALNAIVRAHGTLAWGIEPSTTRDPAFPTSMMLFVGSTGVGFGIPASRSNSAPLVGIVAGHPPLTDPSRFDRVIGSRGDGRPLVAHGVGSVGEVAAAVRVPMGLELLPPSQQQAWYRPGFDGVTLTGMTLRDALATLVALDPRYEWRDLDGVIVFRPAQAWGDASHPLFRLIDSVRLDDVTASKAIGVVTTLLGAPEHARNSFPDSRTFSVDLPQGTMLDLLNGIARSHGQMHWQWQENSAEDRQFFAGRRYTVLFSVLGGLAQGFAVP